VASEGAGHRRHQVKRNLSLLAGIHPDAIESLKSRPITAGALKVFRKVKAVRQIDMAQLMVCSEAVHVGLVVRVAKLARV
jgi:hypothetical protein